MIKNIKKRRGIVRRFFSIFIFLITFIFLLLVAFRFYIFVFKDDVMDLNMEASRLSVASIVYIHEDNKDWKEYMQIFSSENRIWVDFADIPKHMKDAIVSIEDKRFYSHRGIDFIRTSGAVFKFLCGKKSHGGSTITQQLIKNITEDSEVSFGRKIREAARAIRLEERFSKDEILESYLNVVNFGAGCRGVQAAAGIYFGKDIKNCSLAQCAAIAAITQNPSTYNPLTNPSNNKLRRDVIIKEMYAQGKITKQEFNSAILESEKMVFKKYGPEGNTNLHANINNWHVEVMCKEITTDLMEKFGIKKGMAEDILYSGGLKIYSAMDERAQKIAEKTLLNAAIMPNDRNLEIGFIMINKGRILAILGSSKPKSANLIFDHCNSARRQPGSAIKPLSVYAPAIDFGIFNFSSIIPDKPLHVDTNGSGELRDWPNNWYNNYRGNVTLQWAIEKSANAPAAQVLTKIGAARSFAFLGQNLGFDALDPADTTSLAALATGGMRVGVTVREMAAAFQIFGSGGKFYKPYTYVYVTDKNGKVILDKRREQPIQAIGEVSAGIMNRLLRCVIIGSEGTGHGANISGWEIAGKTGTTNHDFDAWFCGVSPYASAAIWLGYDSPHTIRETGAATRIWRHIMAEWLENKENIEFSYSPDLVEAIYCVETGFLANSGCVNTAIGFYDKNNMPPCCCEHNGIPCDLFFIEKNV
jgi:penicillin-binding protein 1A